MLEQSGKQVMMTQCSWLLHQSLCQQHQYTACRDAKHPIASGRIGTYALSDATIRLRERVRVRESAIECGIRAIMFHNVVQHRSVRQALCFGNRQYKARHQHKSAQQANVRAEWQASNANAMLLALAQMTLSATPVHGLS